MPRLDGFLGTVHRLAALHSQRVPSRQWCMGRTSPLQRCPRGFMSIVLRVTIG
jgi:hypothetical protein